jgi:hypothetical protein
MIIQFKGQVTRKDIEQSILKSWTRPRYVLKVLFWLLVPAAVLLAFSFLLNQSKSIQNVLAYLFLLLFYAAIFFLLYAGLIVGYASEDGSFYSYPIEGTIEEHGIILENRFIKTVTSWDAFENCYIFTNLVVLSLSENHKMYFPESLFDTDEDWIHFQEKALEKIPDPNLEKLGLTTSR